MTTASQVRTTSPGEGPSAGCRPAAASTALAPSAVAGAAATKSTSPRISTASDSRFAWTTGLRWEGGGGAGVPDAGPQRVGPGRRVKEAEEHHEDEALEPFDRLDQGRQGAVQPAHEERFALGGGHLHKRAHAPLFYRRGPGQRQRPGLGVERVEQGDELHAVVVRGPVADEVDELARGGAAGAGRGVSALSLPGPDLGRPPAERESEPCPGQTWGRAGGVRPPSRPRSRRSSAAAAGGAASRAHAAPRRDAAPDRPLPRRLPPVAIVCGRGRTGRVVPGRRLGTARGRRATAPACRGAGGGRAGPQRCRSPPRRRRTSVTSASARPARPGPTAQAAPRRAASRIPFILPPLLFPTSSTIGPNSPASASNRRARASSPAARAAAAAAGCAWKKAEAEAAATRRRRAVALLAWGETGETWDAMVVERVGEKRGRKARRCHHSVQCSTALHRPLRAGWQPPPAPAAWARGPRSNQTRWGAAGRRPAWR